MKKYWNLIIDDFLMEKQINEWLSFKSLESYYSLFNLLIRDKHIKIWDTPTLTTANFRRFLWTCLLDRNWSSWTYNTYRKYLRVFCKYLVREWYLEKNPIDEIKKRIEEKKLPKSLNHNQVMELFTAINTLYNKDDYISIRNKTLVLTLLYTWLRKSELLNLKICDVNLEDWYLKVIKWKGSKDRVVPLKRELQKKLLLFLQTRISLNSQKDYLFSSMSWNRLQSRDMRLMIDKIRLFTTFHFTWHMLRHTFATELVRNNFDIYNISQILWHCKVETTKIYLSVDTHKIWEQINKINMFA